MPAVPPAGTPGAKSAEAVPPRQRKPYADSDCEEVGHESDTLLKYKPQEGFTKPLDKKAKILAGGELNLNGKTSNLSISAQGLKEKAKTKPKGNKKEALDAKAKLKDAFGRAHVAIVSGGGWFGGATPADKAFYKNSKEIIAGLETLARIATNDEESRFVRETIADLEVFSPSSIKYYQKRFNAARELSKPDEIPTAQAA